MTKTYKIKEQDYYNKEDIQIEISEEIVTPVETKKTFISVSNLKNTIEFLKNKKQKLINEIDAEIDQNQIILSSLKKQIESVEIKKNPIVLD